MPGSGSTQAARPTLCTKEWHVQGMAGMCKEGRRVRVRVSVVLYVPHRYAHSCRPVRYRRHAMSRSLAEVVTLDSSRQEESTLATVQRALPGRAEGTQRQGQGGAC